MKKRMLTDVMGVYNLPPLEDGKEVLAFQIEQAEYFLSKMRAHEGQFREFFERDELSSANKQRKRYVFNFAAFLHAARVFVYMLKGTVKGMPASEEVADRITRNAPFRAFMIMRDANTHRVPLHYSLTYQVTGSVEVPLRGIVPSRIQVDMLPHLEVREPPLISLNLELVRASKAEHVVELATFVLDSKPRESLTYMCAEFIDEMRKVANEIESYLRSDSTEGESEI